jgi:hypothetical protein
VTVEDIETQNRETHREADRIKTDLSTAEGLAAPTGQEAFPVRMDPNEARKAIFNKSNEKHAREVQDNVQHPASEEMVRAMEAEARGEPVGSYGQGPANNQSKPPSQKPNVDVTLNLNGRSITVAQHDIDRAGGQASYLQARGLEEQESAMARQAHEMREQRRQLDAETEQLNQRRAELSRQTAAVHDAPATTLPRTGGADSGQGAAGADLEARAQALADRVYSGDVNDAKAAFSELLTDIARAKQSGDTSTARAEQLAAELQRSHAPPAIPQPAQPAVDPAYEVVRQKINRMGATEYPLLHNDPSLAKATANEITRLANLPKNRDRLAIDIAREACDNMMAIHGPRGHAQQMKQGLPASPTAGGSAPIQTEAPIATGSAAVEMMRQRRTFGPR